MNDTPSPSASSPASAIEAVEAEADRIAREKAAKQRFFALSLFRLSGIVILIAAWFIILGKVPGIAPDKAKILGAIIAFIGLVQTIIVPRLLGNIWRSPRT